MSPSEEDLLERDLVTSRRGLLVATGSVALAGCSALNTDDQNRDPPTIEAGYTINGSTEYGGNITLNSTANDADEYLWEINNQTHTGEEIELEITHVGNISINHTVQRSLENGDTIADSATQTLQDVGTIDPDLTFDEIYESTYTSADLLASEFDADGNGSVIDQLQTGLRTVVKEDITETDDMTKAMKQIAHQELGYSTDEVIIDKRQTGGSETYTAVFTNENGEWHKHLAHDSVFLRHGEQTGENSGQWKQRLDGIWGEGSLTIGAATEIDDWRRGVEKVETRKEYGNQKWLGGSMAPDVSNDSLIVKMDTEEQFKDYWGKIGYTRDGIEILDQIQDHDDNTSFNPEVELTKRLTEHAHNALPQLYGEGTPVDEETYIRVGTRDKIEQDLEKGIAENPYPLTEQTEEELWAVTVPYEEHKKEAFNWGIPESLWPEKGYPEEEVKVSGGEESPYWVWNPKGV